MTDYYDDLIKTQLKFIEMIATNENSSLTDSLDKLIPVDAEIVGVDSYQGYILNQFACPKCKRPIGDEIMVFSYCPGCGQRIGKL